MFSSNLTSYNPPKDPRVAFAILVLLTEEEAEAWRVKSRGKGDFRAPASAVPLLSGRRQKVSENAGTGTTGQGKVLLIPLGSLSHGAIAHASRTRGLSRCAHSAPQPAFAQRALSNLPPSLGWALGRRVWVCTDTSGPPPVYTRDCVSGGDEGAVSPWVVLLLKANPGWRLSPFRSCREVGRGFQ